MTGKAKNLRGFGSLSKERRQEISSMGGKESWKRGKAHKWTPEEAREAGLKGGRPRKTPPIQNDMLDVE